VQADVSDCAQECSSSGADSRQTAWVTLPEAYACKWLACFGIEPAVISLQNGGRMALQTNGWEALNRGTLRLYRELDSEKHSRVLLEVLNELVPSESLAINIASVHTPYALSAVTLPENHATPEQLSLLGKFAHQSPFATYYLATMDSNWKMATDFMPLEDFHNTDLHRQALGPLGINHQMFGMLGVLGHTGYAVALNRTHREFTERDREMLNVVHPHLVSSFFNAAAHTRSQSSVQEMRAAMEAAPGAYGYFNDQRQVAWMQSRAEEWLQEFFPTETKSAGNIPKSIRERLEQSAAKNGTPQQFEQDGAGERLVICLGGFGPRRLDHAAGPQAENPAAVFPPAPAAHRTQK
jgi:hypothetical protein